MTRIAVLVDLTWAGAWSSRDVVASAAVEIALRVSAQGTVSS